MSWLQTTEQKTRSHRSRTLDFKFFENKDSVKRKHKYHTRERERERERQKKHQPGKWWSRWQESQATGGCNCSWAHRVWQLPRSGHFPQNHIGRRRSMNKYRLVKTVFAHAAMWPAVQSFDGRNVRKDMVSTKSSFYWTESKDSSNFRGGGSDLLGPFYSLFTWTTKDKIKDSMWRANPSPIRDEKNIAFSEGSRWAQPSSSKNYPPLAIFHTHTHNKDETRHPKSKSLDVCAMGDVSKIKQTMQKERINANNTKKQKKWRLRSWRKLLCQQSAQSHWHKKFIIWRISTDSRHRVASARKKKYCREHFQKDGRIENR